MSNGSLLLFATVLTGCDSALSTSPRRDDARPTPADAAPASPSPAPARAGKAVVDFWRAAGPGKWFAKDPVFDQVFRDRFRELYEAAARGELSHWCDAPESALALVILLDQYPRNSFRGTPKMYATDSLARAMTSAAIAAGHDRRIDPSLRLFLYLPYGHSESLADQDRSVELGKSLDPKSAERAEHHRDIIRRFGRFPHRNAILGRASRPEEARYLAEGGYAG